MVEKRCLRNFGKSIFVVGILMKRKTFEDKFEELYKLVIELERKLKRLEDKVEIYFIRKEDEERFEA
jgi:hypothetical protein